MPQRVEGPYLAVLLRDLAYAPLYGWTVPLAWSRVFAGGGYEDAPHDAIYGNAARNQEVVEMLLDPLVDRNAGAGARST